MTVRAARKTGVAGRPDIGPSFNRACGAEIREMQYVHRISVGEGNCDDHILATRPRAPAATDIVGNLRGPRRVDLLIHIVEVYAPMKRVVIHAVVGVGEPTRRLSEPLVHGLYAP